LIDYRINYKPARGHLRFDLTSAWFVIPVHFV